MTKIFSSYKQFLSKLIYSILTYFSDKVNVINAQINYEYFVYFHKQLDIEHPQGNETKAFPWGFSIDILGF